MVKLLSFVIVLLLAGCSTPEDLKRDYQPYDFKVNAGYQLVLKRLVERYRECAASPLLPIGQVINDVQNYPDLRSATIVRGASGFGTQTHQVFDIRETGPGRTEVRFTQRFAVAKFGALYEKWANGEGGCDP